MQDHMGSMLETEFPDHKIHFLYDIANMKAYQDKYKQSAQIIRTLLMELLKSNNSDKIYVRLHGYKSWLVIRIALEEKPEELVALSLKSPFNRRLYKKLVVCPYLLNL